VLSAWRNKDRGQFAAVFVVYKDRFVRANFAICFKWLWLAIEVLEKASFAVFTFRKESIAVKTTYNEEQISERNSC
jgi:hypothetical protein